MFLQLFLACVMAWMFMNALRWTATQAGSWYVTRRLRRLMEADCGCEPQLIGHAQIGESMRLSMEAHTRMTHAYLDLGAADAEGDLEKRAAAESELLAAARAVHSLMPPNIRAAILQARARNPAPPSASS